MPFPNEHSCRLRQPSEFQKDSFRRINLSSGLDAIIGRLKGKKTTTTQALRYDKIKWAVDRARNHCKGKGGSFEAASKGIKDMIKDILKGYTKIKYQSGDRY